MNDFKENFIKEIFDSSREAILKILNIATHDSAPLDHMVITMGAFVARTQELLSKNHSCGFTSLELQKTECKALRELADTIELSIAHYEKGLPS